VSEYQLYLGDCLEFMRTLDADSVDAVIADPPYGMSWDTDSTRFSNKNSKARYGAGRSDWGEVINDDGPFDPAPFIDFPAVILWGANHYAQCLPVGTTLVWVKRCAELYGSFLSDAEIAWKKGGYGVYCFEKQFPPPSRMAQNGGVVAHPNQKPIELMRWCIERVSKVGDTIFDPFMGSGTTGVACMQLGRNFIGCEIEQKYYTIAERRIKDAADQPPLFHLDAPKIEVTQGAFA
jgi:site-specific DNA-methyltransferase (adenine-specific)